MGNKSKLKSYLQLRAFFKFNISNNGAKKNPSYPCSSKVDNDGKSAASKLKSTSCAQIIFKLGQVLPFNKLVKLPERPFILISSILIGKINSPNFLHKVISKNFNLVKIDKSISTFFRSVPIIFKDSKLGGKESSNIFLNSTPSILV